MILAAGRGRRLGEVPKAVLRGPDGATFLETIASRFRRAAGAEIVVVTGGRHRAATEAEAGRLGLAVVVNPSAERGMASSVASGFAFARAAFAARAAFLWPVDHALVWAETLACLAGAAEEGGVVVPRYVGRGGHPVAVGRALWGELARCEAAPAGARTVLRERGARRRVLDVADPGAVCDIDTPRDRARLARAEGPW